MADLIPFQPRPKQAVPDEAQVAAVARQRQDVIALAIDDKIRSGIRLRVEEYARLAENLHLIINEVVTAGVRKGALCQKAGLGDGDSRPLHDYTRPCPATWCKSAGSGMMADGA